MIINMEMDLDSFGRPSQTQEGAKQGGEKGNNTTHKTQRRRRGMYTSHGFDDPSNITCHHQSADIKSSWSAIDWTTRVRNLQHTEMNTMHRHDGRTLYGSSYRHQSCFLIYSIHKCATVEEGFRPFRKVDHQNDRNTLSYETLLFPACFM